MANFADGFVHPSAVLDEGADLGRGVRVWHFCHVCEGAVLGEGVSLGQNVYIGPGVRVGARTKVQNNVSVYQGVTVERDCFIGPSAVFTNVRNPRGEIDRIRAFSTTTVRCGATIGANATIVCGNEIGAYAFVGAGSVVTRDVAAYALVVGTPARQLGWVGRGGERLAFSDVGEASCTQTGERYRLEDGQLTVVAP